MVGKFGIIVLSCSIAGWIKSSMIFGNKPTTINVPARMKIGISMRLDSFIEFWFNGVFPYIIRISLSRYAVWRTLVKTPITASQLRFASIAAVKTKYLAMNPPKGGTPENDNTAITKAILTRGIFLPNPEKSSKLLNPWLFITPTVIKPSAVVMPPIKKK